VVFIGKKLNYFFYFFLNFSGWDGLDRLSGSGRTGLIPEFLGFYSRVSRVRSGRVGSGTGWTGRVGTSFFQFFLPAPVLDPPVLTSHGSSGFEHESGWDGSRPRVGQIGSDPVGFF
jgi:hypothetical protein